MFLEAHFGEVEFHMPDEDEAEQHEEEDDEDGGEESGGRRPAREESLLVELDEAVAKINLRSLVSVYLFSFFGVRASRF